VIQKNNVWFKGIRAALRRGVAHLVQLCIK